eukprot:Lankesteria_metandrocarpae@DN5140_c0_g1_i5.p1
MCSLESCLDELLTIVNEIDKDSNFLRAAYNSSQRDQDILEADVANLILNKANEVADLSQDAYDVSQQARRDITVSEIIYVLTSLEEANAQRLGVLLRRSSVVPNSNSPQISRLQENPQNKSSDPRSRFAGNGRTTRDKSHDYGQLCASLTRKSTGYPALDGAPFGDLPKVETPPSRFHVPNLEDCGLSDETLALLSHNKARPLESSHNN